VEYDQNKKKCRSGTVEDDKSCCGTIQKKFKKSEEFFKMSFWYGNSRPFFLKCRSGTVTGDQNNKSVISVRSKTTEIISNR